MTDLKQENFLTVKKELSGNFTDQLLVGIYRTSVDGKILYANRTLATMFEYTIDEIYNIKVQDIYLKDNEREVEVKSLLSEPKEKSTSEIFLKTKTGKVIIVKDTVNVIRNKNGEVLYFDGVLEDITEKKKAEKDLKEEQARYKILTDLTIEGIIIHHKGIIIDINPSLQKMIGYNADELIGKRVFDFIHPDSRAFAKKNVEEKYSGIYELTIIKKDKSVFVAEVEAKNVTVDHKDYRVVALRDTTKRRNTEKEILTLSTAIKQSPVSVVITDLIGNIEYVNPKFTEVTGYTFEEAIGKNPNILKTEHTPSADYKEMWETISSGKTWTGEFLNKHKDGTHYWELASISPIIDDKGHIIKYLAVKEDITVRKKTEDALRKSEKDLLQANATKNMFFSIMAHDLKGPIGSFLQLLNLYKENFNDISNVEKLDYVNILIGLSTKTNDLLEDLLLWARIQMQTLDYSPKSYNLKSIVNKSINIIEEKASEKNITIENKIDETAIVVVNESSIKTVIRNLLSNAIKFSYKNSSISVRSKINSSKKYVEIAVKDSGMGISKRLIDQLFKIETVFTTYGTEKEKGTGLGLILCKELVEKNNGTIWVESKKGSGSTFYVTLPIK